MTWKDFLHSECKKDYFQRIQNHVQQDANQIEIYPKREHLFAAFDLCPIDKLKVFLLGQDPYHGPGQAHGLSFSVLPGVPIPPSLLNIYKELKNDLGIEPPRSGCLRKWAEQGVFLLNSILTVPKGQPGAHKGIGWETFTDNVIKHVNGIEHPIVFMLWGAFAKSKLPLITNKMHLVLEAAHPSPFSAYNGFFGCKHFSKANEFLMLNGIDPINWKV